MELAKVTGAVIFKINQKERCQIFALYTLSSVTGSGHVKYQENPLACKLRRNSAWKIYLLLSLTFTTVTKPDKWSYKSKKGTGHVFYMATPSHTNQSVLVAVAHILIQIDELFPKGQCSVSLDHILISAPGPDIDMGYITHSFVGFIPKNTHSPAASQPS